MTQVCSTFAAPQEATPRTQAGGRGNGGMIITVRICNPEDDNEAGAGAVRMAQLITMRHHIDSLLIVTDQCNVIIPSLREQRGNATLAIFGTEGGAM